MERKIKKHHHNESLSEAEKSVLTAYNIGKTIPECVQLLDYWNDLTDYREDAGIVIDRTKEIFEDWLDCSDEGEIFVKLLELETSCLPAYLDVRSLVDDRYKVWFNKQPRNIPALMVRPLTIFFPISKRAGHEIVLDKPIVRETKSLRITIRDIALPGRDFKTINALVNILRYPNQCVEVFKNQTIYFTASLSEIAREMQINPSETVKDAILHSLERLRKCTIVWRWQSENGRKQWKIGGILDKVYTLQEDSNDQIGIFMDMDFFRLYRKGSLKVDDDILYSLHKDREILMYVYLLGQAEFNMNGRYGGRTGIDIFTVYDNCNLEGLGKQPKTKAQKRYELRQVVEGLINAKAIGRRSGIKDDKLKIYKKRANNNTKWIT